MLWARSLSAFLLENIKVGIESTVGLGGIIKIAWIKMYDVICVIKNKTHIKLVLAAVVIAATSTAVI